MLGGKIMDTFMDKLAQKLTAQEMIKANMAADAEEMNKLRAKEKEYAECLEQMQKLIETGVGKLETAQVDCKQLSSQVELSIERIAEVMDALDEQGEDVTADLEELKASLKLLTDNPAVLEELKKLVNEKLDSTNENVHKECVKVYRNVQAAVVEENGKLTESISGTVNGLRGRINAIFGISIAALVLAAASVVLQVLNLMNFKFF